MARTELDARTPLVAPADELDAGELQRYSRQIRLPQIGLEGQRRLKAARVVVLGAGGLGSPVLQYLAAAGVGTIGIVDDDVVDASNLQRQVIHTTGGVGSSKAHSARASILRLNPLVSVELHETRLNGRNAARILSGYDLVIDGTDNFETRYLANDTAALLGMPYVWGSVLRFDGQVSTFWSGAPGFGTAGVTLRDLFALPPADDEAESCSIAGVLGPLCGVVGAAMASEAMKLVVGFGEPLFGRVLVVDALDTSFTTVPFRATATAAATATATATATAESPARTNENPDERLIMTDEATPTDSPENPSAEALPTPKPTPTQAAPSITAAELSERLAAREAGSDDFVLLDVREPWEHELVSIDGAVLVPMDSLLADSTREMLPTDETIVVHCHHDGRSRYAREVLRQSGYTNVTFVEGGIDAWARDIDPTKPRY